MLSLGTVFEIEHIYAKSRVSKDNTLSRIENVESLGNKAILEKRINIRASDYHFSDKVKYYKGYTNNRKQVKEGTKNAELLKFALEKSDFSEQDIINRRNMIIEAFLNYLSDNNLIK